MTFSPEFYNEGWTRWDDMKIYGSTARHTRRFVFPLLGYLKINSALDAGCGTGHLLQQILEKYPHAQATGSEYSTQGIELAKARLPNAYFHTIDLSKENLGKKFELITCIDVLEHIEDDRAALKNLLTMTSKYMILSVPLGPLFKVKADRIRDVHGYSCREVQKKLREAGFGILKEIQRGFPFYNLHRCLVNRLPEQVTMGGYGQRKKLSASLLYWLFFLNLSPTGGKILCIMFSIEQIMDA
jgi:trans-aconitate methyltransferase